MENGYIKLWRKSLDSRVFKNDGLFKVWAWCLLKASHKKRWFTMKTGKGEIEIELNPGQFVYGRLSAAESLNMKPSTVRNRMAKLENMQNLVVKKDSQYSIVTIVNWKEYQPNNTKKDSKKDSQRTAKGQPKDTDKKVEKVKKVKKKRKFIPPTQKEVTDYFLEKGFSESLSITAFNYYNVADWKDGKGNQVNNWKQKMISVWLKDKNKEPQQVKNPTTKELFS